MTPREQTQATESSKGSPLIESDSLVEEVSIDGMCGVY
jgi:mycofactocin precursor